MFFKIPVNKVTSAFILILMIYNVNSFSIYDDSTKYPVCNIKSDAPAQRCTDFEITIRTNKDKQDILDKINARRDKVASGDIRSLPAAANMMKMEWNNDLEILAKRWANQCFPYKELDTTGFCKSTGKIDTGQNIATIVGQSSGMSAAILVDVWYMELLNINSTLVFRYLPSRQTQMQHYDYFTQLIWAQSYQVGCGGVRFKDHNQIINRLVCNFAPEGNHIEQPIYTNGYPCSQCPYNGVCDSTYLSLCKINLKKEEIKPNGTKNLFEIIDNSKPFNHQSLNVYENITPEIYENNPDEVKDHNVKNFKSNDNETAFDYYANLFHSVISTEKVTTRKVITCKDIMPVDDFIEVFKQRLIKDQDLKAVIVASKTEQNKEASYTDPSVADFMSHIYSKKEISTTVKPTEADYSNSTLLADLVEAVIFRNNVKTSSTEMEEEIKISDVNVIRIKPELGKVQTNSYSTGHYFFPVEYEEDVKETTEAFYDISSIAISDIALEIEELKRNRGTRDFLEEILESDSIADLSTLDSLPNATYHSDEYGNKELSEDAKDSQKVSLYRRKRFLETKCKEKFKQFHSMLKEMSNRVKKRDATVQLIYYRDLLKKIASEIGVLKLNERFHCSSKSVLPPYLELKLLIISLHVAVFIILL